jgi:tetratricopeptide (TPR) repeat protein
MKSTPSRRASAPRRLFFAGLLSALSLAPAITLSSCASSPDDKLELDTYIQNAGIYLRENDDLRCLDQVERGLELDSDNYRLHLIRGQVLVRMARDGRATWEDALQEMQTVYGLRSVDSHDYRTLLNLGQAHFGLAIRNQREAAEATQRSQTPTLEQGERERLRAKAAEHVRLYERHVRDAQRQFKTMLDKGDGTNPALRFLFQVETYKVRMFSGAERKEQIRRAIEIGERYLVDARARFDNYSTLRAQSLDLAVEADADRLRSFYQDQVFSTIGLLGNLHYEIGQYEACLALNNELVQKQPNQPEHYFNRGKCHHKLENWDLAIRDFQDFLRMTGKEQGKLRAEIETLLDEALDKRR